MPEFIVVPDEKMPSLYVIKYDGGNQIPDSLLGLFSTRIAAKKKVMFYEARPKSKPIEYKGKKHLSDVEEQILFEKVKLEVAEKNRGKEKESEKESTGGTECLREGADNGGEPSNIPGEREPS